jgi:hypothetical protein
MNGRVDCRGDLAVAIADMDIFRRLITPTTVGHLNSQIRAARLVVADGNLSVDTMKALANVCSSNGKPLFFEPTSDHKCVLPVQANAMHQVGLFPVIFFLFGGLMLILMSLLMLLLMLVLLCSSHYR